MTTQELTDDQIDDIFAICRKYEVIEYEIQLELVDHLATSIEVQMEENLSLSFEESLNSVVSTFGENGIREITRNKRKTFKRIT